jgi:hypothetical protein
MTILKSFVVHIAFQNSKWFGEQRVGTVSKKSGKGKHTTRHVSLLPVAGGGFLADTPGFNQPSLLKVTKQSLAETFPEVCQSLLLIMFCLVTTSSVSFYRVYKGLKKNSLCKCVNLCQYIDSCFTNLFNMDIDLVQLMMFCKRN